MQHLHKEVIIVLLNKWLAKEWASITNSWSLFPKYLITLEMGFLKDAYFFMYFSVEGSELSSISQEVYDLSKRASLVAQTLKSLLKKRQETWVWSRSGRSPEDRMATHSSMGFAWESHGQGLAGYSPLSDFHFTLLLRFCAFFRRRTLAFIRFSKRT